MMDNELLELFFNKYTTKAETMYRLPLSICIEEFWPEELQYRRERAKLLPLYSAAGKQYMFNMTNKFIDAADRIAEMARGEAVDIPSEISYDSIIEEAYYSSSIEGALSTKEKAKDLIASGKEPSDKDERMILNNYNALKFVLDNLDSPFSHELIIRIAGILTEGMMDSGVPGGYRDDSVFVISRTGETVYTAPAAEYVEPMMTALLAYLNEPMIHPVEKAVIAHMYFVLIHPFFDGNGRTARTLTYMVLMKSGYDFFKYVPISGILSEQRGKYYKAIRASQDEDNGYDFTYFAEYYADLLAQTLEQIEQKQAADKAAKRASAGLNLPDDARIIRGIKWLVDANRFSVTATQWEEHFGVSFETARSDLMTLEQNGFLSKKINGRKIIFNREF